MELRPFAEEFPSENIHHHFVGQDQAKGVYAKEVHIPAGYHLVSHKHLYDHLSVLVSGRVCLSVGPLHYYFTGPRVLTIEAGKEHSLRALTDAVWLCIHPTDETDASLVDDTLIEKDSG